MAVKLSPPPRLQFLDADGVPYAAGKLYTYVTGSTTPKATYSDAETPTPTPNLNPIILDDKGMATVYLGAGAYKFILKDTDDNLVFTADPVTSDFITATGAETIQNKTIDSTNVIEVKDSNFTLLRAADITAKLKFSASAIATGTTRTVSVVDADITMAGQNYANVFTKRQQWGQGAAVAAANDLTLGADGNSFYITGGTQVNRIATANWTKGAIITLSFAVATTVKYNQATGGGFSILLLQGAADFHAGPADQLILKLEDDGGGLIWVEIGRAIHSTTADGLVRTDHIQLNNAETKALPTTDIDLIDNPGSDRIIQVLQAVLVLNRTAGIYVADAASFLQLRTKTGLLVLTESTEDDFMAVGADDKYIATLPAKNVKSALLATLRNESIVIHGDNNGGGDFTGGDSANTLDVYITYLVQVLP